MSSSRSRFDPRRWLGPRSAVLIVAALVVLSEFGLRGAGYGQVLAAARDRELGWVHLPDQEVVVDGVRLRTNTLGFRDEEWPPIGVHAGGRRGLRLLVLGDSVTYADGLPEEQRWTERLEARLRANGRDVRVMNAAMPGYCFEQMITLYQRELREYRPDVVLVALSPGAARPAPPSAGEDGPLRRQLRRTATYDFWLKEVVGFGVLGRRPPRDEAERALYARIDRATAAPFALENEPLWKAVEQGLVALRNDVGSRGGDVVAVAMPRLHAFVDPSATHVGRVLGPRCRRRSFPLCDPFDVFAAEMAPLLEEVRARELPPAKVWAGHVAIPPRKPLTHLDRNLFPFGDEVHWTARAHELLAERVCEVLEERGLLDRNAEDG